MEEVTQYIHGADCFCWKCRYGVQSAGTPSHLLEDYFQNEEERTQPQMGIDLKKYHTERDSVQMKRRPFMKKTDLPKDGKVVTAQVLEVREVDWEFSQLALDLKMGKKEFTIGISEGSVFLDQIITALGKNTDKWKNKKVGLYLAKGKYINVETD